MYLDLPESTTPLVKMMAGKYTRSFRNFRYDKIDKEHFKGERTVMFNDYKLVLDEQTPNENGVELYNLNLDLGEKYNVADEHPEIVKTMEKQKLDWQQSVLNSLTGADYKSVRF